MKKLQFSKILLVILTLFGLSYSVPVYADAPKGVHYERVPGSHGKYEPAFKNGMVDDSGDTKLPHNLTKSQVNELYGNNPHHSGHPIKPHYGHHSSGNGGVVPSSKMPYLGNGDSKNHKSHRPAKQDKPVIQKQNKKNNVLKAIHIGLAVTAGSLILVILGYEMIRLLNKHKLRRYW